jgi:hypothetical protein
MQDKHVAEVAEAEVVGHFASVLPDLGKPKSDAARIAAEVRDRSGLLVELRPGYFGFSHLTFQEYLAALDYVYSQKTRQLVGGWKDPWWSEVITLAAGVEGSDPAQIVRALLACRAAAATILAAKCLQTAVDLPRVLRRRVEKALEGTLRKLSWHAIDRQSLGEIELMAAPILVKELHGKAANKANILLLLEELDYEPAIPAITHCLSDVSNAQVVAFKLSESGFYHPSVREVAARVLLSKAATSHAAKRAFLGILNSLGPAFLEILVLTAKADLDERNSGELLPAIEAAIKAAPRDKTASTPARSTG